MDEFPRSLTPAEATELTRRRRGKNWVVLIILFALAALFYAISMVKFKVS